MVWASCPDMIYADVPIVQKGCHNIVNIVTLLRCQNECCHNVVEMFSYNVLRQYCGNVLETFLEYVAAILFANVFTTFPQCCGNVAATIYY